MVFFAILSGIASIVGLGFSIAAWYEARNAKREAQNAVSAAQEARKAVRKGGVAEVLKELNHNASELVSFVQNDQFQAASVRARDLFSQIGAARQRWERFLSEGGSANLNEAQAKVKKISNALMRHEGGVPPEAKGKLLDYSHVVVAILIDESSRIVAAIEMEEE